jgi:hypothetical protein
MAKYKIWLCCRFGTIDIFCVHCRSAEETRTGGSGVVVMFAHLQDNLLLEKFLSLLFLTNASTEATDTHEDLIMHVHLQKALTVPFLGLDVQWISSEGPRAQRIID